MAQKPKSIVQKKMLEARQHIKIKEYQEAQAILERIDQPTAKEWLKKIHDTWFENAAKLVKAGQYAEALEILHKINHPKASKWIKAAEKRMLNDDPFAEDANEGNEDYHPEVLRPLNEKKAKSTPKVNVDDYVRKHQKTQQQKRRQEKPFNTRRILLITAASVIIMIIFAAIYEDNQQWKQYEDDARVTLDVFCSVYTYAPDYRCTQWANEVIKQDKKNGFHVYLCKELYLSDDTWEPQMFADCLAGDEIYLP